MTEIIQTIVGFGLMGILCWYLEKLWPEDHFQPRWRRDSLTDVIYFGMRIFLSTLVVAIMALAGFSIPARSDQATLSSAPLWLQVIVVLLLSDLITYWVHRIMHFVPSLWRIHAIHHSAEHIDWLVAARNHPLELIIQKLAAVVVLYALGFSPDTFAAYVPACAAYSILLHANLTWSYGPFGYVIASPAFHRWHHSSETEALDKNFSQLFSLFDFVFRTAYFPQGRYSQQYGLKSGKMPDGIWAQLLYPFRRRTANAAPTRPPEGAEDSEKVLLEV